MSGAPTGWTPAVNVVYVQTRAVGGDDSKPDLIGDRVDPCRQLPQRGTGVSTISGTVDGPVSLALIRGRRARP
jgi:hypothetical protein